MIARKRTQCILEMRIFLQPKQKVCTIFEPVMFLNVNCLFLLRCVIVENFSIFSTLDIWPAVSRLDESVFSLCLLNACENAVACGV